MTGPLDENFLKSPKEDWKACPFCVKDDQDVLPVSKV